eukprot:COSAG01_NODE_5719_length_4077_cov_50.179990_2_plen_231_part_00
MALWQRPAEGALGGAGAEGAEGAGDAEGAEGAGDAGDAEGVGNFMHLWWTRTQPTRSILRPCTMCPRRASALTIDEDEIARQLSPEIMKTWINLPPPESKAIALTRPDSELWKRAYNIEHRAFNRLKVMTHGHTAKWLRDNGITDRPVPLKHILSVKKADGNYDKHKCRLVLCGHKGFMIAGKHYQETYSATVDTARENMDTNSNKQQQIIEALRSENEALKAQVAELDT